MTPKKVTTTALRLIKFYNSLPVFQQLILITKWQKVFHKVACSVVIKPVGPGAQNALEKTLILPLLAS